MQLHRQLCNYNTAASPSKFFETKFNRFGQMWLDLGDVWAS